jgi:hypothetical protein
MLPPFMGGDIPDAEQDQHAQHRRQKARPACLSFSRAACRFQPETAAFSIFFSLTGSATTFATAGYWSPGHLRRAAVDRLFYAKITVPSSLRS